MCLTEFPAVSNYHISPAILYQNEAINRCKKSSRICDLTFFTFFPAIYSTYNGSARKKSSRIFSCARVRITASPFPPANMCIYIMVARRKTTGRLRWLVAARIDHGHILPRIGANPAQIGSGGMTRLL